MSASTSDIFELEASYPVKMAYRNYLSKSSDRNDTMTIQATQAESFYFLAMARILGLSKLNFHVEGSVIDEQGNQTDIDQLEAAWMRNRTLNLLKVNPEIRWKTNFMMSVVIAHRNRINFLLDLFETLTRQSEQNFEVVVVDDFSSAEARKQLQEIGKKIWPFPLRFIFLNKRMGARKARNWGSQAATGSHLFFVDDDNLLITSAIEIAKKAVLNSPFNILVCPLYRVFQRPKLSEIISWEKVKSRVWVVPGGGPRAKLGNSMGDMGFIIARETYIRLGGLNERTDLACEDWAILMRAENAGLSIGVLPIPLQIYYDHPNSFFKRSPVYISEISALKEGSEVLIKPELDNFEKHKFSSNTHLSHCILQGYFRVLQDDYSLPLSTPSDQNHKTLRFFMGAGHDGTGKLILSCDNIKEELVFQIKKGTRKYVLTSEHSGPLQKAVIILPKGVYFFQDGFFSNSVE